MQKTFRIDDWAGKLYQKSSHAYSFYTGLVIFISGSGPANEAAVKIDSTNKEKSILPKQSSSENKAIVEENLSDAIFTAHGTEPFWSVTAVRNKFISFWDADNKNRPVNFPFREAKKCAGGKVFITNIDADTLRMYMQKRKCSDGMSDLYFPYSVTLFVKGVKYVGCGETATKKGKL